MTTKAESVSAASRRVALIAGGGRLPQEVAATLAANGEPPFVIAVEGEADADYSAYPHEIRPIEDIGKLPSLLRGRGITHLVLAGSIGRRPQWRRITPTWALLGIVPRAFSALLSGDDSLLRVVISLFERNGIAVVGAHEIVPELLASEGVLTTAKPTKSDSRDLDAAYAAARMIGALDIGQAAVAVGGRAIALEGIEGTDGLLARTRDLRGHGRIAGRTRGVLVKCAKPGQELRADLPAIGPATVEAAHAAGLVGIGVEADRSLILEAGRVVELANQLGLFIIGLPAARPAE